MSFKFYKVPKSLTNYISKLVEYYFDLRLSNLVEKYLVLHIAKSTSTKS